MVTQLVEYVKYGLGPECHAWPKRVLLPSSKAQLAGGLLGTEASSDNAQGVIQNTVDETAVCTVTPNWCAVLRCSVNQG